MTERLRRDSRSTSIAGNRSAANRVDRTSISLFAQDEWTLVPGLTANLGVRGDRIARTDGVVHVQPRTNLVWQPAGDWTLHAGYARSVASAPVEEASCREARSAWSSAAIWWTPARNGIRAR